MGRDREILRFAQNDTVSCVGSNKTWIGMLPVAPILRERDALATIVTRPAFT